MSNNLIEFSNDSIRELPQENISEFKGDTISKNDDKPGLVSIHTNSSQICSLESEVIAIGYSNDIINNDINDNNHNDSYNQGNNNNTLSLTDEYIIIKNNEIYLDDSFIEEYINLFKKEEIKKKIKKKMKEGLIPFFIWSKGHKPVFYYGKPETKFGKVIKNHAQIIKKRDNKNLLNNSYYYNNQLIEPNISLKNLHLKPLSIIKDEQ